MDVGSPVWVRKRDRVRRVPRKKRSEKREGKVSPQISSFLLALWKLKSHVLNIWMFHFMNKNHNFRFMCKLKQELPAKYRKYITEKKIVSALYDKFQSLIFYLLFLLFLEFKFSTQICNPLISFTCIHFLVYFSLILFFLRCCY